MTQVTPAPRGVDERRLEQAQQEIQKGKRATRDRDALIVKLNENGMSVDQLAARLTRASLATGGRPITANAVSKIIKRRQDGKPHAYERS